MNANFEVKYTLRLYDPALIAELASQHDKQKKEFRNKNEFMTQIIELGLAANRVKNRADNQLANEANEDDEVYKLLQQIFSYLSIQFKSLSVKQGVLENLICSIYNIVVAINNGDSLFEEKIEQGFYDDIPPRCKKIIEDLKKRYGLA